MTESNATGFSGLKYLVTDVPALTRSPVAAKPEAASGRVSTPQGPSQRSAPAVASPVPVSGHHSSRPSHRIVLPFLVSIALCLAFHYSMSLVPAATLREDRAPASLARSVATEANPAPTHLPTATPQTAAATQAAAALGALHVNTKAPKPASVLRAPATPHATTTPHATATPHAIVTYGPAALPAHALDTEPDETARNQDHLAEVVGDQLRLRAEPNTDAVIKALLPAGEIITVTGQSGGCDWLHVRTKEGTGWVRNHWKFVTLRFEHGSLQDCQLPPEAGVPAQSNP